MSKVGPELLITSAYRDREAFMAEAIFRLPIVDKDHTEQDIVTLRRKVRGKEKGLYVDTLAIQAQDGNPISSAVAIERIREELRAITRGISCLVRPHRTNGTKPRGA